VTEHIPQQSTYIRRFIRGALQQAPATLFSAVFSLAVAALYTRMFTPEQYGVYSFVIAITGPLITVMTEWVAQPIGRFYNEYMRRDRPARRLAAHHCVSPTAHREAETAKAHRG